MKTEIEAKIKIDDAGEIERRIAEAGGQFKYDLVERDSYFLDDGKKVVKKGCGLRLRIQTIGDDITYILTWKGPKQKTKFKTRDEIEMRIDSIEDAQKLLGEFGCEKALSFEKKRKIYTLGGCSVSIDTVVLLGDFVEVEGPDEKSVNEVVVEIGLSPDEHISEGYAKLMKRKLESCGDGRREIFFDKDS